jgi:hypothetical protein
LEDFGEASFANYFDEFEVFKTKLLLLLLLGVLILIGMGVALGILALLSSRRLVEVAAAFHVLVTE